MTRKHIHKEDFPVSAEKMFELLITPSSIRKWWGASRAIVIPEKGGIWMAAWGEKEDQPDYISAFTMSEFDVPNRILFTNAKYTAGGNEPDFVGSITAEFIVEQNGDSCSLTVIQDGFPAGPEADEFYAGCEKGWTDTFAGIRRTIG